MCVYIYICIYIHICLYVYINIIISGACPHEPESERASEGTAEEQATLGRPVAICLNSCVGPTAVGLRKPSLPTCSQSISGSSHVDYHRTSSLQASPSGLVYIHIYAYIVYYTNMRIYIYIHICFIILYIYIYIYMYMCSAKTAMTAAPFALRRLIHRSFASPGGKASLLPSDCRAPVSTKSTHSL